MSNNEKKYFGVMLDASRNGVMKPEQVKIFAATISKFGYNMIQLYTEDTFEVDDEPYFGYMRGRYSQDEIRDIVAYCNSIGVEVIPCVQTLAHLNQIFRWSPYKPINDTGDILLVDDDRTYRLIENIFKTIRKCFTSSLIHIGMDEAHFLGLGKYLDKHGYNNRCEILLKHLDKVVEIAKKYGFKPMIWSDMFFRLINNGEYYMKNVGKIQQEIIDKTPRDVKWVYWDYYHVDIDTYRAMIKTHKQLDNELWFAGGAWSWKGFVPSNHHSLETMQPAMKACKEFNIDNVFITMWGDNGKECSYYAMLPSLYAIKRFYDGETRMSVIKDEFYRITGEKFDELMALDVPDMVNYGEAANYSLISKAMLYSDPFNGFLDSTITEGEFYHHYVNCAKRFAKYAKHSKYDYIFKSMQKLCNVLAVKNDLGVRTRRFYQNADKNALKELIVDYKKVERGLKEFYSAFKDLWFRENKPQGFDVQDLRLGGLMQRMKACRERLESYVNGEIDSIPELEEKLLDYYGYGDDFKKKSPFYIPWTLNASTNII